MALLFYPRDGSYAPFPGIFATWLTPHGDAPNPCRKYHVSSDLDSAETIAAVSLPILRGMGLYHKIVQSMENYRGMQSGQQVGKFITVYAPEHFANRTLVTELGGALSATPGILPSPSMPRSRSYDYVFAEQPLDPGMFIYGGYVIDPSE